MKARSYISKTEHSLFLILTFTAFIFSILGLNAFLKRIDQEHIAYEQMLNELGAKTSQFSNHSGAEHLQHTEFLIFLISLLFFAFLSVFLAKKFYVAFLLIISSFLMFVYWFFQTRNAIYYNEGAALVEGLDTVFYKASGFDLTVLFLVTILLFWQISVHLRILIKTLQGKPKLP